MGNRFGGVAGVVAMGAALALALVIAMTNGRIDLRDGTYVFTEPATNYVDESLVLVEDGIVTDVWISDADRQNEFYGYTPRSPREQLDYAQSHAVNRKDGDLVVCAEPGTTEEYCEAYAGVTRAPADLLAIARDWEALGDGTYRFDTRSVTWESPSRYVVEVKDGVVQDVPSPDVDLPPLDTHDWAKGELDWVLYWVHGEEAPFAACRDNLPTYDDEWCVVWTPVAR